MSNTNNAQAKKQQDDLEKIRNSQEFKNFKEHGFKDEMILYALKEFKGNVA